MKTLVNIIVIVLSLLLSPFLELSAQVDPFQSPSAPPKIDPFESPTAPKKAPPPSVNPFIRAKPTTKASEPSAKSEEKFDLENLPPPPPPPIILPPSKPATQEEKPRVITSPPPPPNKLRPVPRVIRPTRVIRDGSATSPFDLSGDWEIITIPIEGLVYKIPNVPSGYEPFGVYANKIFLKRKKMPPVPKFMPSLPPHLPRRTP